MTTAADGHCHRLPELLASKVPGWPAKTLLTTLIKDAEVESRDELATLLADCK